MDLVKAVKDHALAHYEAGGWDVIVEGWSDEEIARVIAEDGATTPEAAIAAFADVVDVWSDRQAEADYQRKASGADDPPTELPHDGMYECEGCGRRTHSDEGLCYECQTIYHAAGAFDMDGRGWL